MAFDPICVSVQTRRLPNCRPPIASSPITVRQSLPFPAPSTEFYHSSLRLIEFPLGGNLNFLHRRHLHSLSPSLSASDWVLVIGQNLEHVSRQEVFNGELGPTQAPELPGACERRGCQRRFLREKPNAFRRGKREATAPLDFRSPRPLCRCHYSAWRTRQCVFSFQYRFFQFIYLFIIFMSFDSFAILTWPSFKFISSNFYMINLIVLFGDPFNSVPIGLEGASFIYKLKDYVALIKMLGE